MSKNEEDLGMIFFPSLGLIVKVHRDGKGEYVKIPKMGKLYLKEDSEGD